MHAMNIMRYCAFSKVSTREAFSKLSFLVAVFTKYNWTERKVKIKYLRIQTSPYNVRHTRLGAFFLHIFPLIRTGDLT